MKDCRAIEKQAAASVEKQNKISGDEAAWHSFLRYKNREESVKPDLNFIEDSFNLHMENLYMKHPQNMNYKKDLPIYIDQENPNRYFSLTCGVIHTWAQALVSTSLINRAANFFANSKFFELGCQWRFT